MKKIVALVLSLVMVLGLATTAFAAEDKYDLYKADDGMAADMLDADPDTDGYDDLTIDEVAAKTNKDGSGNVAYLKVGTMYATKTTAPTVTSYAVCEAGKTTVLYYVDITTATSDDFFKYTAAVTAFNNFSAYNKCGYVTGTADATKDYFLDAKSGKVFEAAPATGIANGVGQWLLNGEVVIGVNPMPVVDHYFIANNYKYDATLGKNIPTSALCTTCMETSTAIYLDGKAPAGSTVKELNSDKAYCVVPGAAASAPVVDGDKVESAQTFDAGIAMYVGMSVMAAAGSAVVLKKKD